jgi:DNA-binding XRE family transcriptional regulator
MTPKQPEGKPLAFKTVEELEKAIEEYFAYCENRIKTIWDDTKQKEIVVTNPAPYTMSGLARRLGIDRRTLIDYAHRDKYLPTIKAARERIHEDVETRLMEKQATGAIFNLKNNFGWKDESHTDITSGGESLAPNVSINTIPKH